MKRWWPGTLLGLALAGASLYWLGRATGPGVAVADVAGPLLAAAVLRFFTLGLYAFSWAALLARRPGFWQLLRLRWIGEAINGLLPVLQVGGDLARARLLAARAGVPPGIAAAGVVLDLATGVASQAAFTLLGVVVLMGGGLPLGPLGAGVLLFLGGTAALLLALRFARPWLLAWLPRLRLTPVEQSDGPSVAGALDERLARPRTLVAAFVLHLAGWLSQAAEVWLVLRLGGTPVTVGDALVIESLAGAARAAAFFLPGGLGAQEAAIGSLALLVGVPPQAALGLIVVKRLREVLVGLPALALWAFDERHGARRLFERLHRRERLPGRRRA